MSASKRRGLLLVLGLGSPLGCLGLTEGEEVLANLLIEPTQVRLESDGMTPATQAFRVTAVYESGALVEVTASAAFGLSNPGVGTMAGATFSTGSALGTTLVEASWGGRTATAFVEVVITGGGGGGDGPVDPGQGTLLPEEQPSPADLAPENPLLAQPRIIYPYDRTMLPGNMVSLQLQWRHRLTDVNSSPRATHYSLIWRAWPDLTGLTPSRQEVRAVDPMNLSAMWAASGAPSAVNVYETTFATTTMGSHFFFLKSGNLGRLFVNGVQVVNQPSTTDQWHENERSGSVVLSPGTHTLRVERLDFYGDQGLAVNWQGPGFSRRPLRPNAPVQWTEYIRDLTSIDLASLTPSSTERPEVPYVRPEIFWATVTRAAFRVATAGSHEFHVTASHPVRLEVNGTLVIDGFGISGETTLSGSIVLPTGKNVLSIEHRRGAGVEGEPLGDLTIEWSGPDLPRRAMTGFDLGDPNLAVLPVPPSPLYEIQFENVRTRVRIETPCTPLTSAGCIYVITDSLWKALSEPNLGREPLTVRVVHLDPVTSTKRTSSPIQLFVAPSGVEGAAYYWTSSGTGKVMRTTFGSSKPAEVFYPSKGCGGCHAVSRDGTRMAVATDDSGAWHIVDVASRTPLFELGSWTDTAFSAFSPTGDELVHVVGLESMTTALTLRNGLTGAVLGTIPIGQNVSHPVWSNDGDRIVFSMADNGDAVSSYNARIALVERLGPGWSAPIELVPRGESRPLGTRVAPDIAPSGDLVLFTESLCEGGNNDGCDGKSDSSSKVWAVRVSGGPMIELAAFSQPDPEAGGNTNLKQTFPKFTPKDWPLRADGTGRMAWVMFSSLRYYGLHPYGGADNSTLLWMGAVDLDELRAGRDGSYAPFVFPNQDLKTANHMAYWTEKLVEAPSPAPPPPTDAGVAPTPDAGVSPPPPAPTCLQRGERCEGASLPCCAGLSCESSAAPYRTCQAPF